MIVKRDLGQAFGQEQLECSDQVRVGDVMKKVEVVGKNAAKKQFVAHWLQTYDSHRFDDRPKSRARMAIVGRASPATKEIRAHALCL